jgi:S1-C subfamily serine protease
VMNIASQQIGRQQNSPFASDPLFRYFFGDRDDMYGGRSRVAQSLGSGVVVSSDGYILTNNHVVGDARAQVSVVLPDKRELRAKIVGVDEMTDIALLKIDAPGDQLHPLQLGDSSKVEVGDPVVAIGNPFGLDRTVTSGIVSALQRQIEAPAGFSISHVIQTDAAINPGNSGGPLIDAEGRVIGINSQIETGSGGNGNVGIGFAIPINTVRTVASQIITSGKVEHAFLGLNAVPVTAKLAQLFHLPTKEGLLVQDVQSGSGAAKVGLVAGTTPVVVEGESYQIGGDIIMSIDGEKLTQYEQLRDALARHKPGDKVHLEIYHHGSKKSVTAKLGLRPNIK